MTEHGAAVVRLAGRGPWLEGRPGDVLFVRPDGTRFKLFEKQASHRCPGGDGLGEKTDFADVDARGRIAIAHEHAISVFDREGSLLARRDVAFRAPQLGGWHREGLIWADVTETGESLRLWNPADGRDAEVEENLELVSRSADGAELHVESPGPPPFVFDGARDIVRWRTSADTDWRETRLPEPRSFLQWFARHYVLFTATEKAPYALDTRTGRFHRLFESNLEVLAASSTSLTLLLLDGDSLGIADETCLARALR